MARIITNAMANALKNGYPRGLFVKIEHPDGDGYFCTGDMSRTWNGHTWQAAGRFGAVTPLKHTSEIAIQDISFRVSGIDSTLVANLSSDVRNKIGTVWLACFNLDNSIVRDPYQLSESELDYQTLEISDDGTATIEIIAHAGFYTLGRGIDEAWTPENQRSRFSTDTGLDLIPALQNQDLQWKPS